MDAFLDLSFFSVLDQTMKSPLPDYPGLNDQLRPVLN